MGGRKQFCMDSGDKDYKCASCDECDCSNGIIGDGAEVCGEMCPEQNQECNESKNWSFGYFPDGSFKRRWGQIASREECRKNCANAGVIFKYCFHHVDSKLCMAAADRRQVFDAPIWLLNEILN